MTAAVLQLPGRRGRGYPPHRAFVRMFPNEYSGVHGPWMYAVGLRDGRVKVGTATHARERINHYCVAHEGLAWAHLFARIPAGRRAAKAIERRALTLLGVVAKRTEAHSEYFRGADRETVLRVVVGQTQQK